MINYKFVENFMLYNFAEHIFCETIFMVKRIRRVALMRVLQKPGSKSGDPVSAQVTMANHFCLFNPPANGGRAGDVSITAFQV
jgi:hypothetical protein